MSVDELKAKGNAAFSAGNHDEAIKHFTDAIAIDGSNHVLYSNRSAAYAAKGEYEKALGDADKCISINPQWPKGYNRKGAALSFLRKYDESKAAYNAGLQIDPNNELLKNGLKEVEAAANRASNPMGELFGPQFMVKLATNPKTAPFLQQPDFMQILGELQRDGLGAFQKHSGDPRVQAALQVALGMPGDMSGAPGAPGGAAPEEPAPKKPEPKKPEPKKEEPKEEPDNRTDAQKEAAAQKAKGNDKYKAKDLDGALVHYNKAIELDPEEMLYLTNRAAVKLEKGDIDGCLEDCRKAVEVGRANRADYKNVAKAFARMGNAYLKQQKYDEAIKAYNDSLMENRTQDVLKKLSETELAKRKADALAYRDPVKAEEAKERGNAAFKDGKFPDAIKQYDEAIKRNPEVPAYYSNRAAAYQKLGEFPSSIKDCDKAIELDKKFGKAYVRKGNAQLFMKEYHKAQETYQKGLAEDPENADLKDGLQRVAMAIRAGSSGGADDEERARHAMADPEIQGILQDPMMRLVLQDLQQDPQAAMKHMSNPDVANKINKLIAAGIVKTG